MGGKKASTLRPGDYFGEIALLDEGERMATITAATDLLCYGLTYWDFRPVVEANGSIGWKLPQGMVRILRDARKSQSPAIHPEAKWGDLRPLPRVDLRQAIAPSCHGVMGARIQPSWE